MMTNGQCPVVGEGHPSVAIRSGRFSSMLGLVALALSTFALPASAEPNWSRLGRPCGRVDEVKPGQLVGMSGLKMRMYTARRPKGTCCSQGKLVASTRTRKWGSFEFKGMKPGKYFLVIDAGEWSLQVPLQIENRYDVELCRSSSTGRLIIIDSPGKNATFRVETRIY